MCINVYFDAGYLHADQACVNKYMLRFYRSE